MDPAAHPVSHPDIQAALESAGPLPPEVWVLYRGGANLPNEDAHRALVRQVLRHEAPEVTRWAAVLVVDYAAWCRGETDAESVRHSLGELRGAVRDARREEG